MTTPGLSAEMFGWLRDVLFLLTVMVIALCGIAVVAITCLCVETFRQVSTVAGPPSSPVTRRQHHADATS